MWKKLFLNRSLLAKELNIIDQQGINGSVVAFKLFDGVVLQRFNHVLNKTLEVHIDHFGVRFARHNAVPTACSRWFYQTRPAINPTGLYAPPGYPCNLTRRRTSQLVRFTFNKVVKRMFHVDVGAIGRFRRAGTLSQPGRTIVGATRAV